jgi:hypothetical protein
VQRTGRPPRPLAGCRPRDHRTRRPVRPPYGSAICPPLWPPRWRRPGVTLAELVRRAAEAAHLPGENERAAALARRALVLLDPEREQAAAGFVHERIARYLLAQGATLAALEEYLEAAALVPEKPSAVRASILAGQGHILMLEGDATRSRELCEKGIAIARGDRRVERTQHARRRPGDAGRARRGERAAAVRQAPGRGAGGARGARALVHEPRRDARRGGPARGGDRARPRGVGAPAASSQQQRVVPRGRGGRQPRARRRPRPRLRASQARSSSPRAPASRRCAATSMRRRSTSSGRSATPAKRPGCGRSESATGSQRSLSRAAARTRRGRSWPARSAPRTAREAAMRCSTRSPASSRRRGRAARPGSRAGRASQVRCEEIGRPFPAAYARLREGEASLTAGLPRARVAAL